MHRITLAVWNYLRGKFFQQSMIGFDNEKTEGYQENCTSNTIAYFPCALVSHSFWNACGFFWIT